MSFASRAHRSAQFHVSLYSNNLLRQALLHRYDTFALQDGCGNYIGLYTVEKLLFTPPCVVLSARITGDIQGRLPPLVLQQLP